MTVVQALPPLQVVLKTRHRIALGATLGLMLLAVAGVGPWCPTAWAGEHGGGHPDNSGHATGPATEGGHPAEGEETAPETFVVLDLFAEALEASVAGVGVKIAELKPKIEHINELYDNGERHRAFAQILGISTELVLVGFFIETFGIGEMFVSALSFSGNWAIQLAQSTVGVMASTKVALLAGEKVEEAVEEKFEHSAHAEVANKTEAKSTPKHPKPPRPKVKPSHPTKEPVEEALNVK